MNSTKKKKTRKGSGSKPLHAEVRFHLSSGKHYMHWQVKVMRGSKKMDVYYYHPNKYQLEMVGCKLVNQPGRAKQVFDSGVHNVSGWVRCNEVIVRENVPIDDLEKLYYNPVRDPYWRRESDTNEFIWDGSEYVTLVTKDKQVYILEERA